MYVTLFKNGNSGISMQTKSLIHVLENIRDESKSQPVSKFRESLHHGAVKPLELYIEKIPRILFSAEMRKEEDGHSIKTYNGLIVLSISGLSSKKEAEKVREKVAKFPQTMAAFIGSSDRSVKIIIPFARPDESLPTTTEEIRLFHAHAYHWAVNFYRGQLQNERYDITLRPPKPDDTILLSFDPELYYAPSTYPIQLDQPLEMPVEKAYLKDKNHEKSLLERMLPGYERYHVSSTLFETSLKTAYRTVGYSKENEKEFITDLARNCYRSGIPQEEAVGHTFSHFRYHLPELLIRETIGNVYTTEKLFGQKPCIPPKQSTALLTDEFMNRRYEFRHNMLTGAVEYREQKSLFFNFEPVNERVLNTIAVNAMHEGLDLWDRDVKRWIHSSRVSIFSPILDFMNELPRWDGKDRISTLAAAVPCNNTHWGTLFHRWFLSMVSHWQGMGKQYANSVSPLLVGPQGCGKSTFCRHILPPELQAYYTDSIDFSHRRDAELYLTRFLLINIDEFDQISVTQQGFLKHILQKPVVNTRKPHQTAVQEMRRYASFIATSNHSDLLSDPSGSRRFICINITGKIQTDLNLNYAQLYAQAIYEIQQGERCYFSKEEEALMMEHNKEFEMKNPLEELILRYFRAPHANEQGEQLMAIDIMDRLQKRSGMKLTAAKLAHIGRWLHKLEIPCKRTKHGTVYLVVEM